MRLGLCCTFLGTGIAFRTTTARYASTLAPARRRDLYRELGLHNAGALRAAIAWCAAHGVGAFRIGSGILPLATHPEVGYRLDTLDRSGRIGDALAAAGRAARAADVRLSFHPDQFVVPGSASAATVASSIAELEHQALVAERVGAEQVTIHGGGAQGGKAAALERLRRGLDRLSPRARRLVVLENDDRVYTVADLLPICRSEGVRLVYDVHHHRCNPDGLGEDEALAAAVATWGAAEPWAHVSSPAGGWDARDPRPHAEYIAPADVPRGWLGQRLTVDVEAKAKDRAVLRLLRWARAARPSGSATGSRAGRRATGRSCPGGA